MNKWKIAEIVLSAVSALISAVKSIMKFISNIGKIKHKSQKYPC